MQNNYKVPPACGSIQLPCNSDFATTTLQSFERCTSRRGIFILVMLVDTDVFSRQPISRCHCMLHMFTYSDAASSRHLSIFSYRKDSKNCYFSLLLLALGLTAHEMQGGVRYMELSIFAQQCAQCHEAAHAKPDHVLGVQSEYKRDARLPTPIAGCLRCGAVGIADAPGSPLCLRVLPGPPRVPRPSAVRSIAIAAMIVLNCYKVLCCQPKIASASNFEFLGDGCCCLEIGRIHRLRSKPAGCAEMLPQFKLRWVVMCQIISSFGASIVITHR